jgi:hypothetical protein
MGIINPIHLNPFGMLPFPLTNTTVRARSKEFFSKRQTWSQYFFMRAVYHPHRLEKAFPNSAHKALC